MGFGTKFRELRENRGLSRVAADEVFGLTRGTCSDWENGYSEPETELLEAVAIYFRVPVRYLTEEIEPKKSMTIRLNLTRNINQFINIVSRYPYEMILRSGRDYRDAKSVLGVISMDLNNPLTLEIYHDDCGQLIEELSPFIEDDAN